MGGILSSCACPVAFGPKLFFEVETNSFIVAVLLWYDITYNPASPIMIL